jgi:hypothetical protein
MPSIKVTPTKGLFQRGGTSAIPNGTLSGEKRPVLNKSSAYTLTVADSGKIITLSSTAFILSLPGVSASKGCHYSVVSLSDEEYSIQETTATDTNVLTLVGANKTGSQRDDAFTKAALSAGAVGDRFEIYSTGDYWVIRSFTEASITAT